jgi:hypothetical protein
MEILKPSFFILEVADYGKLFVRNRKQLVIACAKVQAIGKKKSN